MRWIAITLVFVTSVCYAKRCPDPRLQQAVIGGETIDGSVRLHNKPLKFAQVRLFFSKWRVRLGREDRQGWRIPHQTASARHLSSRRTRMGKYEYSHQPRFEQTIQRTNGFLLSATHGGRVHCYRSSHKLTDCCRNIAIRLIEL